MGFGFVVEILLTKKNVSNLEWQKLINVVSKYNGYFKKWKLVVLNDMNNIRYFILSNYMVPSSIDNLDFCLFKEYKNGLSYRPGSFSHSFFVFKQKVNILELINYFDIKKKSKFKSMEISFFKVSKYVILNSVFFYIRKVNGWVKERGLFFLPSDLLSVDFSSNKRFFYKSPPKYLEINKVIPLLSKNCSNALFSVDTFPYLKGKYFFRQRDFSFDKHSLIIGSSGSGKSKFICSFINNIYRDRKLFNKYKFVVIDPHASLEDDIGGLGKVIDFKSLSDSINLFCNDSEMVVSSVELLLDLFRELLADRYNSKVERVLRYAVYLLLVDGSFNFNNLRKLILDMEYRNDLVKMTSNKLPMVVVLFFSSEFNELKTKSYTEAISPIISFIDEMGMVPVFNEEPLDDILEKSIQNNFLTLFSLDRTVLGERVTKTISFLVMEQLFTIMQQRKIKEHIIFIVDEVSLLESPILCKFLSEARKYNLSLMLAGQYFSQLSGDVLASIFANTINHFIFRVSKSDAEMIVDNINMKLGFDDTRDNKVKMLSSLGARNCIVRVEKDGELLPACKMRTIDFRSIPRTKISNKVSLESRRINNDTLFEKSCFKIDGFIDLKEILKKNSTSRKVLK